MKILCPAKINLFLNILGKKNNMHELLLVNQTIDLYDEIELIINNTNTIRIESNENIPLDENNSIYKAAKLFKEKYNINDGMTFKIKKRIPVEAGLGGESTDAAGTILILNEYYQLNLSKDEMSKLGISIGSDVPYFIYSGYKIVKSIGDKIETPKKNPYNNYIIIKPNFGLNTKEMFNRIDNKKINKKSINKIPYNDFMKVVPDEINIIEKYLNDNNIKNHTLSGSGSSYYIALKEKDNNLYKNLKDQFKDYLVLETSNCDKYKIIK